MNPNAFSRQRKQRYSIKFLQSTCKPFKQHFKVIWWQEAYDMRKSQYLYESGFFHIKLLFSRQNLVCSQKPHFSGEKPDSSQMISAFLKNQFFSYILGLSLGSKMALEKNKLFSLKARRIGKYGCLVSNFHKVRLRQKITKILLVYQKLLEPVMIHRCICNTNERVANV